MSLYIYTHQAHAHIIRAERTSYAAPRFLSGHVGAILARKPDIDAGIEGIFLIIVSPRKFLALGCCARVRRARGYARILGYKDPRARGEIN